MDLKLYIGKRKSEMPTVENHFQCLLLTATKFLDVYIVFKLLSA